MRNTFKALLLSATVFASIGASCAPALASTASPASQPAISAPVATVEAAPAATPQVNGLVSEATAQAVLEQAPVVPDLGLFGKIMLWVVAVNLLLGGLAGALAKIKDMTATKLDDTAYEWISKFVGFLTKILDFATANSRPPTKK